MPTRIFTGIRLFQGFKVIKQGKYVQNAKRPLILICKLQFHDWSSKIKKPDHRQTRLLGRMAPLQAPVRF
jgi:hypothetical protein